MAGYDRIWPGMAGCGGIWPDIAGYGRDVARYAWTRPDIAGYGRIWLDTEQPNISAGKLFTN